MSIKWVKGMDHLDLVDAQDTLLKSYAAFTAYAERARRDGPEWLAVDCEAKAKRCHEVWQRLNDYIV